MAQIRYGSLTDVVGGNYSPIDRWSSGGDFLSFTCSHFLPNNVMNRSKAAIRWNLRISCTYASFQFMNINRDPKISELTAFPWHHSSPEVVAAVVKVTFWSWNMIFAIILRHLYWNVSLLLYSHIQRKSLYNEIYQLGFCQPDIVDNNLDQVVFCSSPTSLYPPREELEHMSSTSGGSWTLRSKVRANPRICQRRWNKAASEVRSGGAQNTKKKKKTGHLLY